MTSLKWREVFVFAAIILSIFSGSAIAWDVEIDGTLSLTGVPFTDGIIFPDGSKQTIAATSSVYQPRMNISCAAGQAITSITGASSTCQQVGTVTSVATGTGLTGGPIISSGIINLANTAVTPGSYTRANITVDAQGRLTAAGSGAAVNLASEATGVLPVANGGTGSATKNFVDLSSAQTITGVKTFAATIKTNVLFDSNNESYYIQPSAGSIMNDVRARIYYDLDNTGFYIDPASTSILNNLNLTGTTNVNGSVNVAAGSYYRYNATNVLSADVSRNNYFFGPSGNLSMTGWYNTVIGSGAFINNTSGELNTAAGWGALYMNTAGSENTALGVSALYNNSTAGQNTAIGRSALYTQSYNNGGSAWATDNTAVGFEALLNNQPSLSTDGYRNTAIGSKTLHANMTGLLNTATGYSALYSNTTGWDNTANGSLALYTNSGGVQNTAVGKSALYSNTGGSYNTAIGMAALNTNISGNASTAVGYLAGYTYAGDHNTFIGTWADAAGAGLTNATAIGQSAVVDASNHVRIGNTFISQIGGQVGWSNLSDIRTKKDILEIGFGLDFINSLRPVQFRLKNGDGRTDFGFIAQDIEALLGTDYNVLGIGGDKDRTLSLRYTDFIAPMVKAMQEQQSIIETQKEEISSLKERLSRIEAFMKIK